MEQIRIDLVPGGVTPNAHASQYDVGRGIRFLLYNGGNSYTLAGTETITVDVTKPDGTTDTVSVTNTSSNYVDFVTTDGLLNQAGLYPCEISIVDGGAEIGSQNFNLRAEADAYDGADIRTVTIGPADICTFETTLAEPLINVKTALTPSLTGYTAVNLTANGDTTTIALGDTYYGGTLDVTTGVLTITHATVDLSSLSWSQTALTAEITDAYVTGGLQGLAKYPASNSTPLNAVCDNYAVTSMNSVYTTNVSIGMNVGGNMYVRNDGAGASPTGHLTYELATPVTVQLSPTAVRAIVGTNNVFADTGTTELTYLEEG